MRTGLFISAFLATCTFGGLALADQNNDNDKQTRGRDIKQMVLEKARENRASRNVDRNDGLTPSERARQAKMIQNKFRAKGDLVDQYEKSYTKNGGLGARTTVAKTNKSSRNPIAERLRAKGDAIESGHRNAARGEKSKYKRGNQVEPAWTPGLKSTTTTGVYFKNDRGQVQNNIRGATATARKIQHQAQAILKSAVRNSKIKMFEWATSGGDSMSMNPGH
jgi:hypothetical protein